MSQRVLILTNPLDVHSFVVREVLLERGADVDLCHTSDFPTLLEGSIFFDSQQCSWGLEGGEDVLRDLQYGSVWLRRPRPPVLPESIQECDRTFAIRECNLFLRSLQRRMGEGAFWVNPLEPQSHVILKPEQLRIAANAGFRVPRTLCSNSPLRVREFLRSNSQGVIYKPLTPVSWRSQDGLAVAFCSLVTEEDLPDDEILRATPGIFQEHIPKAYELRVTAIGRRLFAAKLRSQEVMDARVDWRVAPDEVPMEPAELPSSVEAACRRVLDGFGLVFGCFDLIVTPNADYVFLEVNEMGAFLWIEAQLPELGLLDAFSELLIQAKINFAWTRSGASSRWADIVHKALQQSELGSVGHVLSPSGDTFDEDR